MEDCKEYIFQRLLNGLFNVLCEDNLKKKRQKTLCNTEKKSGFTNTY